MVKTDFEPYIKPEFRKVFTDWPLFYIGVYTAIILFALLLTVCCKKDYLPKIELAQLVKHRENN